MTCQHQEFGDYPFQVPPDAPVGYFYLIALFRKRADLPNGLHLAKYLDLKAPSRKSVMIKNIARAYQEVAASSRQLAPGDIFYLNANVKDAKVADGFGVIITDLGSFVLVDVTMLSCWYDRWFSSGTTKTFQEAWYDFKVDHGMAPVEPPTLLERWAPSLN